jgi:HSP20 family protein
MTTRTSSLSTWNPWQEINALQRQMNRLFEDTLAPLPTRDFSGFGRLPAAEMNETDEAVQIKLEVPGINPDDLTIEVTDKAVAIRGERKSQSTSEEVTRSEFYYGSFQRVIPLPARVQNAETQADYKDGILSLNLPKVKKERNRVVKVKVNPIAG